MLQANFVKIKLRHAASVLVLDMRVGTFLFPKEALVGVSTPAASRNDMAWQRYALCGVPSSC